MVYYQEALIMWKSAFSWKAKPREKGRTVLATLENNRGMFNASPAIVGSRLLLRSNKALYSITAGG